MGQSSITWQYMLRLKTENDFLIDVGYGDLFITPIEIKSGVQYDGRNYFRIDKWNDTAYMVSMSADGIDFANRYTFSLDTVKKEDFEPACLDKQTDPDSYFVNNVICNKFTETGRITIFNDKFVERKDDLRVETPIRGREDLTRYLKDKFNITTG